MVAYTYTARAKAECTCGRNNTEVKCGKDPDCLETPLLFCIRGCDKCNMEVSVWKYSFFQKSFNCASLHTVTVELQGTIIIAISDGRVRRSFNFLGRIFDTVYPSNIMAKISLLKRVCQLICLWLLNVYLPVTGCPHSYILEKTGY